MSQVDDGAPVAAELADPQVDGGRLPLQGGGDGQLGRLPVGGVGAASSRGRDGLPAAGLAQGFSRERVAACGGGLDTGLELDIRVVSRTGAGAYWVRLAALIVSVGSPFVRDSYVS